MLLYVISALRAIVEMLGLCFIAQGVLYLVAGQRRDDNLIYRLFDLLTRPPRKLAAAILPAHTGAAIIAGMTFCFLLAAWLGLAVLRRAIG